VRRNFWVEDATLKAKVGIVLTEYINEKKPLRGEEVCVSRENLIVKKGKEF
jgi:hypothetical protein